ncbi:O-antigen ligase domain-containing protein [Echinicola strongylocentroti]|uniref:O-antigen ligase domain-containing protein n=2 Tax=Echinicola strongylocentroti TaxID=1795355 RepID=A0A2Z4IJ98_9BACT|nr:O-antigen ligase domain-containing protein [Echinicola strongylocentroti]
MITVYQIVFKGKWEWAIFFLVLYVPCYISILSIVFQATGSPFIVSIFQYLKEFILLLSILSYLVFQQNIFDYPFRIQLVDKLFLAFYVLCIGFLVLPIGDASFVVKAQYFKNVLVMGLVYFLGRNSSLSDREYRSLFLIVLVLFLSAFGLNIIEKLAGIHFQNMTGYAQYNRVINDVEPSGNFGLTWTFETQAGGMRLASFFSDPLELASSCLFGFSVGLIGYLTSKRQQSWVFIVLMLLAMGSLSFAASRASFGSFFIMLCFIALIFRLYGLIKFGLLLFSAFVIYVIGFASDEFYYFVVDTITFENASSVGHVLAWLEAIDQMVAAPLGSGLATSGNAGGVTDELRIGGENQFLIFGVQLGVVGMLLYIAILFAGIWTAVQAFRKADDTHLARIAFIAATTKVALLLPLFTANAELYAFVSWTSWWMIGLSVKTYNQCVPKTMLSPSSL